MQDYWNTQGRIFDIQKYSIHDGPGIRTIIFLKGCALRCKWCCNPESQEFKIQTMKFDGSEKIIGKDVTVKEVMDEVIKDMPYYMRSGGGITLSGGESLLQPEFAVSLLRAAQESGMTTAIETTAFAKFDVIEEYLKYLDYVLMDIKHIDDVKHKAFTGQSNKLILENAKMIDKSGVDLTIRVPVIPTFNHTHKEIQQISEFVKTLQNVKNMHLLPYHRMGEDKYKGLGRFYSLKGIEPMTDEYMQELLEVAKKYSGKNCQIGG